METKWFVGEGEPGSSGGSQLNLLPDREEPASLSVTYNLQSYTVSHRIRMWDGGRLGCKQCLVFHVFPLHVTMNYNEWELEDIRVQFFWAFLEPDEPLQLYHYFVNERGCFKIIWF